MSSRKQSEESFCISRRWERLGGVLQLEIDLRYITAWPKRLNSHLGNIWVRSSLGFPGRFEARQRSNAGLVQANLEAGDEGGLVQPAEEGHGGGVVEVVQGVVDPH